MIQFLAALITGAGFGTGFKVADGIDESLQIAENTAKVVDLGKNVVLRAQTWVQDTIREGQDPEIPEQTEEIPRE